MKKFIIGFTVLASFAAHGYDCSSELVKNDATVAQISGMRTVTETERSILLEMTANARKSVELACGLRSAKAVDPLTKVEEVRQLILNSKDISETERSILLEMNVNARKAVELSL